MKPMFFPIAMTVWEPCLRMVLNCDRKYSFKANNDSYIINGGTANAILNTYNTSYGRGQNFSTKSVSHPPSASPDIFFRTPRFPSPQGFRTLARKKAYFALFFDQKGCGKLHFLPFSQKKSPFSNPNTPKNFAGLTFFAPSHPDFQRWT